MSYVNNLFAKFEESLNKNVKLANYSWFNLGGEAEYLFKPKNESELLEFLKEVKKKRIKQHL